MPSEQSASATEASTVARRYGEVSLSDFLLYELEGVKPCRLPERILIAAFCGTCDRPVKRRFDIKGNELVILPWEHHSRLPIGHAVGEIKTEVSYEG